MLTNKIIIVTGGNGLIGKSIIKAIENKNGIPINFDITLNTDVSGRTCQVDVTSIESINTSLNWVVNNFGRIDGLVNNAYPRTSDFASHFEEMTIESLEKNVSWQLNSYIIMCKEVIKIMKQYHSGSIVNVASIYGLVGNDWTIYEGTEMISPAPYAAIKGGIINFSRYLAALYGSQGIRVNTISPGGVFNYQPKSFVDAYEKKVPLKRMGLPEDFGNPIAFLLSEEARYITGHNLIVDGGWTIV